MARYVNVLHVNDNPSGQVGHQRLQPRAELEQLKTGRVQGAALTAATAIEPGQTRAAPPPPLGAQPVTPEQFASNDLVRRMANRHPDMESQLFGDIELAE